MIVLRFACDIATSNMTTHVRSGLHADEVTRVIAIYAVQSCR